MNKIIYLDAAASYLKPQVVVDAQRDFLLNDYANSGRGICARAANVDMIVADTRRKIAEFIGADERQIVFTGGATDGINRVVKLLNVRQDVLVGVSDLDHHSACLPWVASGAKIVKCDLDVCLNIDVEKIPCVDVLVVTAMSNVLGVGQDVEAIVKTARKKNPNVVVVVDAAQYVVHNDIDVKKWDCDFLVFSGHKIGADTGVGVLYIKNPDDVQPDKFGGGMVNRLDANGDFLLLDAPEKFEAGTLPLTQIAGFGYAIDDLEKNRPDLGLIRYMYDELLKEPKVKIVSSREALRIAEESGLDLVKISPNANPPVCKIMNYGKYVYELTKKAKEAKNH